MLNISKTFLEIDYGEHPAFSMYAGENVVDSSVLDEILHEIDVLFRMTVNTPEALTKRFIHSYFRRQIDPLFLELQGGVLSTLKSDCFYYPLIPKALALTQSLLLQEAVYRNENKLLGLPPPAEGFGASPPKDLQEAGCGFLRLPREDIAKLWTSLQAYVPPTLEKRAKTPWEVVGTPLPHQGAHWDLLLDLMRTHRIFEALGQFHKCRMEPLHASIVHSAPSEDWYKDCYADVGLPTAQTSYMHFDGSFHVPKIILYLVDVGPENGPFSVVPRSPALFRSYSEILIHKALDLAAEDALEKEPKYAMHYRRKRYKIPELRRELMKLPNRFRGTSHFGEDVIDSTPLSRTLLEQEVVCTSDKANCILFDGAQNIHRGGLVQKGERWALQLSYNRPGFRLDRRRFPVP